MKLYIYSLLYAGLALAGALQVRAAPRAIDALPLAFEQNEGQSEAEVRFVLRRGGRSALLLQDRVVFGVGDGDGSSWTTMRWSGANPDAAVEGVGQTSIQTHYYIGSDPSRWLHGVPSFEKVRYSGVYAGIDLELYHHDGELEYDFIVSPGADASQIRLTFEGPVTPTLSAAGALQFASEDGVIEHRKPELYQFVDGERRPVEGRFVAVNEREFRFETGDYDRRLALVVDPKVRFSSYIGRGSGRETVNAVVQVAGGDLIAAGTTESLDDFPGLTVGPRPTGENGFAVRLHGEGANPQDYTPTEVMIVGGAGDDGIYDVIESPQGVLLGGNTDSADFPFGSPLGGEDMFVAHWANGGGLDQGARFGEAGEDVFRGFARRNELGVPQMSVYDYDNAGYPSFVTSGKLFAGGDEIIQVRQWNANSFQLVRERRLMSQDMAAIESTRLQWSEGNKSFFMAGSANGDLFPAAALTGPLGTFRPFLAEIPMDAPSLSTASQPVDEVMFLNWTSGAPEDEIHVSALALAPVSVYPESPEFVTARASGTLLDQFGLSGETFRIEGEFINSAGGVLGENYLPDIFATRSLNFVHPVESVGGGSEAGKRRGSCSLKDWETSMTYGCASFTNQYSFENTVTGAAPMANGKDLVVFGGGDKMDHDFRRPAIQRPRRRLARGRGVSQPLPGRHRDGRPIPMGAARAVRHLHDLLRVAANRAVAGSVSCQRRLPEDGPGHAGHPQRRTGGHYRHQRVANQFHRSPQRQHGGRGHRAVEVRRRR